MEPLVIQQKIEDMIGYGLVVLRNFPSAYHATLALRGVWRETVQREKAVMLAP